MTKCLYTLNHLHTSRNPRRSPDLQGLGLRAPPEREHHPHHRGREHRRPCVARRLACLRPRRMHRHRMGHSLRGLRLLLTYYYSHGSPQRMRAHYCRRLQHPKRRIVRPHLCSAGTGFGPPRPYRSLQGCRTQGRQQFQNAHGQTGRGWRRGKATQHHPSITTVPHGPTQAIGGAQGGAATRDGHPHPVGIALTGPGEARGEGRLTRSMRDTAKVLPRPKGRGGSSPATLG